MKNDAKTNSVREENFGDIVLYVLASGIFSAVILWLFDINLDPHHISFYAFWYGSILCWMWMGSILRKLFQNNEKQLFINMKEFLRKMVDWFLTPVTFGLIGLAASGFTPVGILFCFTGLVLGAVVDLVIKLSYPERKMTIWIDKGGHQGKYYEAYADFLWYSGVKIVSWLHSSSCTFDKRPLVAHVDRLIRGESEVAKKTEKDIIHKPAVKVSKSSIQDDIEHIKRVARESGVNMEYFDKIEEILNKKYEEPPAKPMVSPPVVLSVDGAVVTYKKDGKTQSRSRRGFAKQYGEPVLSKPTPERAKKAGQKAKAR